MQALDERAAYLLAVIAYGLATAHAVLLWRRGFGRGEWLNFGWVTMGFAFHSLALIKRGFSLSRCPVTNLFEAVMFVTWVIAGAYVLGGWWRRVRFVSVFLAPGLFAAGIFALQPGLDAPSPNLDLERAALSLHVTLVLLAYAGFGLASLAAMMFLIQETPEGSAGLEALAERFPSSDRLGAVLVRSLAAGLILLTAGLVVSFGLMRERYGVLVRPDPKIGWSILIWTVYLGLMVARLHFRKGLRSVAWGALGGFAFVMLTFWGTNLLSPIHHP